MGAPSNESANRGLKASSKTKIKETCPSFSRGHLPSTSDVKRLQSLALPHVGSFDYFLEKGLRASILDIVPFEIDINDPKKRLDKREVPSNEYSTIKMWLENVKVIPPSKPDGKFSFNSTKMSGILTPRESRERNIVYSGALMGDFCYQIDQRTLNDNGTMTEVMGKVTRIPKKFGDMPIMVMSKACHLRGKKPSELVKMKEEV